MNRKLPEIIIAVDCKGGFGKDGKIPWNLPEDLKHFQELTKGHLCVMGRYTYEDMLDMRVKRIAAKGTGDIPITEILPDRESYVVTSDQEYKTPGAIRIGSLGQVLNLTKNDPRKLFVLGGRLLFTEALSLCNTIHMTILKREQPYDCDVFFPIEILNKKFDIVSGKETENAYYVVYQRK